MHKTIGNCGCASDLVTVQITWNGEIENVAVAWRRQVVEACRRNAEIFGEYTLWHVLEPIAQQEGAVLVKTAIIENKEKFAAVRSKPLNGMRCA